MNHSCVNRCANKGGKNVGSSAEVNGELSFDDLICQTGARSGVPVRPCHERCRKAHSVTFVQVRTTLYIGDDRAGIIGVFDVAGTDGYFAVPPRDIENECRLA